MSIYPHRRKRARGMPEERMGQMVEQLVGRLTRAGMTASERLGTALALARVEVERAGLSPASAEACFAVALQMPLEEILTSDGARFHPVYQDLQDAQELEPPAPLLRRLWIQLEAVLEPRELLYICPSSSGGFSLRQGPDDQILIKAPTLPVLVAQIRVEIFVGKLPGNLVEVVREDPTADAAADFGTLEAALIKMQQGRLVGCLIHCPVHGYEIARPDMVHLAYGSSLAALVAALRQRETFPQNDHRKGACA